MQSSLGVPTKAQQKRFAILSEFGCVCCRLIGIKDQPAEIHHCLNAGKRISHDVILSLCPWHHRAVPLQGQTLKQMNDIFGPSLTMKRDFKAVFGDEQYLLSAQDALLEKYLNVTAVNNGNENGT